MDNNNMYDGNMYDGNICDNNICEANVLSAHTLTEANNYPWQGGEYKVPKVLAEFMIQIDLESKIRLNEPAYEIKRIEKQVFLTQCRYIAPTDKVFIAGYIRKNIEYAAKSCTTRSGIGGVIKDTTVHVPFKAYTQVNFEHLPQVLPNLPPLVARYFDAKRMGKNIREADRSNIEIFNEPIYCELEWSAIFDADIDDKGIPIPGFINEEEFQEFTDKSVLYLCMKLLQKQQVCWEDWKKDSEEKPCDKVKENSDEEVKKAQSQLNSQWNFPISKFTQKR